MSEQNPDHRIICILGMHRSGTSLVTNLLYQSGMFVGEESELLGAEANNEKGHWEHKEVVAINEHILELFGGSWHTPPDFPTNWQEDDRLVDLYARARAFIDSMNSRATVWGFKDPRTCITLPFWQELIREMEYVITVRNSQDVMQSLIKHHPSLPPRKALHLWVSYWRGILQYTAGKKRSITSFEQYFSDWKPELTTLLTALDIDSLSFSGKEAAINDFISPSLKHYESGSLLEHEKEDDEANFFINLFIEASETVDSIVSEAEKIIQEQAADMSASDKEKMKFKENVQKLEHHAAALAATIESKDSALDAVHAQLFAHKQRIEQIESTRLWKARVRLVKLKKTIRPAYLRELYYRAKGVYETRGIKTTIIYLGKYVRHGRSYFQKSETPQTVYQDWIRTHEQYSRENVDRDIASFRYTPKISVIVPVYNIDEEWLNACIESVTNQFYQNWELCLHDDASTQKDNIQILKRWAKKDERIKISLGEKNQHISGASNDALALATGDYIALLDADDVLPAHALYEVAALLNEYPDAAMVYSDEDKIDTEHVRSGPFFKPDWSPDLFLSMNYTSHLGVYKKSIIDEIGGFRKGYEGSQDYDLVLRFIEKIQPEQIYHIPKILYHWRQIPGSTATGVAENKNYALDSAERALADYAKRNNIDATVETTANSGRYRFKRSIETSGKVSIIIPFKDEVEVLQTCVDSIFKKTQYKNYEIILVDNQSSAQETEEYLDRIAADERVTVLKYDKPFNYSAINNYAVSQTEGEFILLMNNDIEAITNGWLLAMLEHAQRPEIGAVGAKLLFPNDTIQHAGITMGIGGVAGHAFKYLPRDADGYFSQLQVVRNTSGVTAACLLTRREVFEEVGGLDEVHLTVGFNDVDFCLKVIEAKYRIVYTPFAELYHYESLSRGNDDELYAQNPEKFKRVRTEREYMAKKWEHILNSDPCYNPNLSLTKENYTIKDL